MARERDRKRKGNLEKQRRIKRDNNDRSGKGRERNMKKERKEERGELE